MALADARRFLAAARNADGSWGYRPTDPGRPEPTLFAAVALGQPPIPWLERTDLRWSALLLPAALGGFDGARALCEQAIASVLALQGEQVENDPENLGYNTEALAWPWVKGTAPWVEPTAYALLSLRRAGQGEHPRARAGREMLYDRQCADGGWNYGNPEVLGAVLESDLPPTAWAVMALPPGEASARGLRRLGESAAVPSAMGLSLALLARTAHGQGGGELPERLLARQAPDGSFGQRCDWTALAACALASLDGPHPFAGDPL